MKARNKSIVLVDQLTETQPEMLSILKEQNCEIVVLDPVRLFSELDWTRYDEDVAVINKIYARVFSEVVIANKKLVCFWPLSEQFGSEWFEVSNLCKANSYELEIYKSRFFDGESYGFSREILQAWKGFVYFLIESLLEDIDLNEEPEEIATLTCDRDAIVLFKLQQEGSVRYTFAFNSEHLEFATGEEQIGEPGAESGAGSFSSFQEMLLKLLSNNDLSCYQTRFLDTKLEKAYYNILAQEIKTKNLIESWILTYSLN